MGFAIGIGNGLHLRGNLVRRFPVNITAPLLSGTFEVGEIVSCSTGSWSGTKPIIYAYQWKLDGVDIVGETASTYTIVLADDTKVLTCLVTATNAKGSKSQLSNAKTVGSNWLLNGGVWSDTGVWEDTSVWID